MKKILTFLTIFFSFFIIKNVKAISQYKIIMNYDSQYTNSVMSPNKVNFINYLKEYIDNSANRSNFEYSILVYTGYDNDNHVQITFFKTFSDDRKLILDDYVKPNDVSAGLYLTRGSVPNSNGGFTNYLFYHYDVTFFPQNYNDFQNLSFDDNSIQSNTRLKSFLNDPINTLNSSNDSEKKITSIFTVNDDYTYYNDVSSSGQSYIIYYSSVDMYLAYRNNTSVDYFRNIEINYNNETYTYTLGQVFPAYSDLVTQNAYLPPNYNDYGDGQYGYNANQIIISDANSSGNIECPHNTDFVNDFCYTNRHNYYDIEDLENATLTTTFDFIESPPFRQSDYYIFTFRVHSSNNYLPSQITIHSGQTSIPITITKTNIINNGIYKDIQLVLKANQSFGINEPYTISGLTMRFPTLSTTEPDDYEGWYFGIYKTYKLSGVGNQEPTTQILETDYHGNDIDSVANDDNNTGWFNKFRVNDRGLSNIITAPIRLFQNMRTATCSSVILPVAHLGNIELPCISTVFSENLPDVFNVYQIIIGGIICYYVGIGYFKIIKNAFTPDNDRIEVQDL